MSAHTVLASGLVEAIGRKIEGLFGLHFPPEKLPELEKGIVATADDLGFADHLEYARRLAAEEGDAEQVRALVIRLTIGETYFFREPAIYETLTSTILPALRVAREGRARRLRIWSAGCCTGEEPCSIAMALRQALPDIADWNIQILATDLNPRYLHTAAAGEYGEWSFRGVSEEWRHRWFRRTSSGRWAILPVIREMISYNCLNLAEDVYPALVNHTNAMDLIFCRNVLMYFSPGQQKKTLQNLRSSLVEGGYLLVSAVEASSVTPDLLAPVEFATLPLYRKTAPAAARSAVRPPAPTPRPDFARPAPAEARRDFEREARHLANEGKLQAALTACDEALREDRLVASRHYLRGVILQEQNELGPAAESFQRALYLESGFVIARYALGHLRFRLGQPAEGARCFAEARAALSSRAPEELLPESDGMTAGRLLAILHSMEEVLA